LWNTCASGLQMVLKRSFFFLMGFPASDKVGHPIKELVTCCKYFPTQKYINNENIFLLKNTLTMKAFHNLLWDFHPQPFLGPVGENALLMLEVRGEWAD